MRATIKASTMDQHIREFALIAGVLAVTFVAYLFVRRSSGTGIQSAQRLLTGVLGAFMVLGGVAKFFEPFVTMFAQQIALSQLPLPKLAALAGQSAEIGTGLALLGFFFLHSRLHGSFFELIFYLAHLGIVTIMLVAIYVHLHPDVPATVLPFQSKPPILTIIVVVTALVNMALRRAVQTQATR